MIRYKLLGEKSFANNEKHEQAKYKKEKSSFVIGKETFKKVALEKIKVPPNTIDIEFYLENIKLENSVIIKEDNTSLVWEAGTDRWSGAELTAQNANYFDDQEKKSAYWKIVAKKIKFTLQNSPTIYAENSSTIQLWPCGGRLNDKTLIEQLYVEAADNLTLKNLHVTTLEQWSNQELQPQKIGMYLGKKVIFHPPYPTYKSLTEFIKCGEIQLTLKDNSGYEFTYKSIGVENKKFNKNITIHLERNTYDYLPNR